MQMKEKVTTVRYLHRKEPPQGVAVDAETFYYAKQIENKVPLVIVLKDDEQLRGVLAWYDKNCVKIHDEDGKSIVIFKHFIKYIFKVKELEEGS